MSLTSSFRPQRLRTHADRPVGDPEDDAFGFLAYADAFSLLINDQETATPLTIAISGPWGSGKTSLAQLVATRLKVAEYWRLGWEKPPITCWFNAWMHSDAPYLGAALAASVIRDISRQRHPLWRLLSPLPSAVLSPGARSWRKVWTGVMAASLALLVYMALLWLFPQLRSASGKLGQIYGHWHVLTVSMAMPAAIALLRSVFKVSNTVGAFIDAPRSAAAQGTLAEVRDQLSHIMRQAQCSWRSRIQRRIVIFVDDLERCPGDKALDMCEVVSQLLGSTGVITVLVADLNLLESAAGNRYQSANGGSSTEGSALIGQEYLHKLVQLRFDIPPLNRDSIASALGLADGPVSLS